MRITKGDYVIGIDGKKEFLFRALEDAKGDAPIPSVLEHKCHISSQRTTLDVPMKSAILNLGPHPHPGKAYGIDLHNLYYTKKVHDKFGTIYFFYKPEKQVVKDLWSSMDKVYATLKKRGLTFLLNDIVWEVTAPGKEKFAGMYIKSKNEKVNDRIQIRPEIMPATEYTYVLLHELGHCLHSNYATGKKLNAQWIRLFNTSIRVATVKKETSSKLLESLVAGEEFPSDFKGQLEEDDALAFKWIIRTISSVHAVTIKELDTLFEAGMREEIRKLWPMRTIPRKELAPIISEYSTKSYRELFAEVFAFQLTGKKLPEPVIKLMDKTVAYSKANREQSSDSE